MDFPEIILVENWQWKMDSWAEDEVTSVLDSISHALITAIATTQGGKEWLKKQAHDYEICLRKLAFLHPALLLRYDINNVSERNWLLLFNCVL